MNTKIDYRIIYNRAGKLDKNGKASIVIEAFQNSKRRYFPTGFRLKPSEWDKVKKQVKGNPAYNAAISKQKAAYEDFEMRFPAIYGRSMTLADFDLMNVSADGQPRKRLSFSAFMSKQIDQDKAKLSQSAYYRYTRTAATLVAFNEGKPVEFTSVDYALILSFDNYLRTVKKYHANTIYKEHQLINQYLNRAVLMDLFKANKNPYLHFKPKKEPTARDVLQPTEIERIEQLTFTAENRYLEFYRDVFLFSIYSGLRISDVTKLKQSDLTQTESGLLYESVSKKTRKTNSVHRLPLYNLHPLPSGLSKPERILAKYARIDNTPLFNRSHPKINENIKKVMVLAGIKKKVTFHTARYSGITWLSHMKANIHDIQEFAQHANITTTDHYIRLAEKMAGERLKQINWPTK